MLLSIFAREGGGVPASFAHPSQKLLRRVPRRMHEGCTKVRRRVPRKYEGTFSRSRLSLPYVYPQLLLRGLGFVVEVSWLTSLRYGPKRAVALLEEEGSARLALLDLTDPSLPTGT